MNWIVKGLLSLPLQMIGLDKIVLHSDWHFRVLVDSAEKAIVVGRIHLWSAFYSLKMPVVLKERILSGERIIDFIRWQEALLPAINA